MFDNEGFRVVKKKQTKKQAKKQKGAFDTSNQIPSIQPSCFYLLPVTKTQALSFERNLNIKDLTKALMSERVKNYQKDGYTHFAVKMPNNETNPETEGNVVDSVPINEEYGDFLVLSKVEPN